MSWCISVSAVGSLREEIKPGDICIPDQFIDRTKNRKSTFFGNGIVAHVPFADPFCLVLSSNLKEVAENNINDNLSVHFGGTYLCMEGPAFSTRAESKIYRQFGADIIGMTNLPEAKLAREAEMSYATLAMVTDYDCWRSENSNVDIEEILKTLSKNTENAKKVVAGIALKAPSLIQPNSIKNVLATSIITPKEALAENTKTNLKAIIGKYL